MSGKTHSPYAYRHEYARAIRVSDSYDVRHRVKVSRRIISSPTPLSRIVFSVVGHDMYSLSRKDSKICFQNIYNLHFFSNLFKRLSVNLIADKEDNVGFLGKWTKILSI